MPVSTALLFSMERLLPLPDAEGIQKMQELYLSRFNKEITEDQAADVLGRIMRLLYLTSDLADSPEETAFKKVVEVIEPKSNRDIS